jgi:hypothetical protein
MVSLLATLTLLGTYAACFSVVRTTRRRSAGLDGVLAGALLICVEAALLQLLSTVHAVTRAGVLTAHMLFAGSVPALVWWRSARQHPWRFPRSGGPAAVWIAALGMLVLVSAIAYAPNNGDSMTYHLARVVYWIQNRSVQPYETNIVRQIAFPPGAEYLLLVLQIVSGSDRLANLVQFGAWIIVVCALPPLARSLGAGRTLSRWAGFLFATAPIALMEASSTQNDLVAAVLVVAIVAATLPFLHLRMRFRTSDVIALAMACAAGLFVKPTCLAAAAPFLIWALVTSIRRGGLPRMARTVGWAVPALIPLAILVTVVMAPVWSSPAMNRDETLVFKPFVYRGIEKPGDRVLNIIRGTIRNIPIPWPGFDALAPATTFGCEEANSLCLHKNRLLINDDTAANPMQMLFLLSVPCCAVVRRRRIARRAFLGSLCVPIAWMLLLMIFRDNVFVTRLQLPLFALAPLGLGAFAGIAAQPVMVTLARLFLAGTAAVAALAAANNGRRPVNPLLLTHSAEGGYYSMVPASLKRAQDEALATIVASGCGRLGMYVGENTYDYPIAWGAVQHGVEVRHLTGPTDWPCLVYSDRGAPPPSPSGRRWRQTQTPLVYSSAD